MHMSQERMQNFADLIQRILSIKGLITPKMIVQIPEPIVYWTPVQIMPTTIEQEETKQLSEIGNVQFETLNP